jgi:hypothetical protein
MSLNSGGRQLAPELRSRTRLLRTKVIGAEVEARQRRQSRKKEASASSDASDSVAGTNLSAIGRAFALQESRNQMRSLKEKGPDTHEVHQFMDEYVFLHALR